VLKAVYERQLDGEISSVADAISAASGMISGQGPRAKG
jgi:hypothetical protein